MHAGGRLRDYSYYGKFIKNRSELCGEYTDASMRSRAVNVISLLIEPIIKTFEKLARMRLKRIRLP